MRLIQIAISIILTVASNLIYSQEKKLTSDSDTTFWFQNKSQLAQEIGLTSIQKSTEKYEIRFWDDYKVIRLWGCPDSLHGEAIYFLRQRHKHDDYSKYRLGELYFNRNQLSHETINAIQHLISDFRIDEIPSMNQVEGWSSNNVHGRTFIVESSGIEKYTFKSFKYINPYPKEARTINYVFQNINSIDEIESSLEKFIKNQPFSIYYDGINSGKLEFSSQFIKWYWLKPRRFFRRIFPPNIEKIRRQLEKKIKISDN